MSTTVVQVLVVVLFALTCGALAAAWTRGRLGRAAIALLVLALVAWIASFVAIVSDVGNADEFATCDANCAPMHYATAVAFIASPLLFALAGLAMIVARSSRLRLRRTRENHG
jgi:cytochrome bd-type quinol oxidase subunit 2